MTHQFKVGQKYRLNTDWTHSNPSFKRGSVHEVIYVTEGGLGQFSDSGGPWCFNPAHVDYGTITLVKDVTPRRHAEMIKKWADDDSLEVEVKVPGGSWVSVRRTRCPSWSPEFEYRFNKPQKSEVDQRIEALEKELNKLKEARKNETK